MKQTFCFNDIRSGNSRTLICSNNNNNNDDDDDTLQNNNISIFENLKRKALENGKSFTSFTKLLKSNNIKCTTQLPERCGFTRTYESKVPLRCMMDVDSRAVVSLALVNKQSAILQSYANKLPIMVLNVSRLLYTTEAFALQTVTADALDTSATQKSLEFYIRTDLRCRNRKQMPNEQFSDFLHRLRSSGYDDYIFELAYELNLNVDFVINTNLVSRYKKVCPTNKPNSQSNGYITVIHNEDRWYVKTTSRPIVSNV